MHSHEITFEPVNVGAIQEFVTMGKLVPKSDTLVTMKDLQDAGVVSKLANGIKLLGTVISITMLCLCLSVFFVFPLSCLCVLLVPGQRKFQHTYPPRSRPSFEVGD